MADSKLFILACLLATVAIQTIGACDRPKYRTYPDLGDYGDGPSPMASTEDKFKCVAEVVAKFKELVMIPPPTCCAIIPGCKRPSQKYINAIRKSDIPEAIAKIIKCVVSIVTFTKEDYNKNGCCNLIPLPFWCTP